MKRYNRNIRFVFFTIAEFLFSSCRVLPEPGGYKNDSHFLFIPVSSEFTFAILCLYLIICLVLFLISKSAQSRVGWHKNEICDNIYNNKGEKIGSIGTGEYYDTYYSQESADNVSNVCSMLQVAFTIALVNGTISSWIFKSETVAFWISFPVLSIIGFIKTIRDEKLIERILSLQLWIWIICAILCIIYGIIGT